jgi:hypothetical protein
MDNSLVDAKMRLVDSIIGRHSQVVTGGEVVEGGGVKLVVGDKSLSLIPSLVRRPRATFRIEINRFRYLLDAMKKSRTNKTKKESLESLAGYLFSCVRGVQVLPSRRTKIGEIDRIAKVNDRSPLRQLGDYILIECKNWDSKVSVSEIHTLLGKLQRHNCRTAVLMRKYGVTGDERHDALGLISDAYRKGRFIIVVTLDDLENIASGENFVTSLIGKYEDLRFS